MRKLTCLVIGMVAVAVQDPTMLPESAAELAELTKAVARIEHEAAGWSLRVRLGFLDGTSDRRAMVDLPAPGATGRVSRHRSLECTRAIGETSWTCRPSDGNRVEVAPPADFEPGEDLCPALVRGIHLGPGVFEDVVPELTDFVRFNENGRNALTQSCTQTDGTPLSSACGVTGISRRADGAYALVFPRNPWEWEVIALARECGPQGCTVRLVDCDAWVS